MKLFIARHGQASFEAESDFERPLTDRGRSDTAKLLELHRDAFSGVQQAWSSQLRRAKETMQVFEAGLSLTADQKPFLSPDSDVKKVMREIQKADCESLLIVSHQPLVGELVSMLIEGNPYRAHPFATSEVVVLDLELAEAGMASLVSDFIPV